MEHIQEIYAEVGVKIYWEKDRHTFLIINQLVSATVPSEIQWASFFFFKMSLMISFRSEILHMHVINHRLIHVYNCMFEHLRLENKSEISCKIK